MRRYFNLAVLILAIAAPPLAAIEHPGRCGGEFLEIPVGARGNALGTAVSALPGELAALLGNPALLSSDPGLRLHLEHGRWYQDLRFDSAILGFSAPGGLGQMALHLRYLHAGSITAYDGAMEEAASFDIYEMAAGLTWARRFARRLDLGGSFSRLHEQLGDLQGRGWSCDLGAGYIAAGSYWSFAVRNLAGGVSYGSAPATRLDRELAFGVARYLPSVNLTVTCDYRRPEFWSSSLRFGAEYRLDRRLYLRGGYARDLDLTGPEAGHPSAGIGLHLGRLDVDYSYATHSYLDGTHTISLKVATGVTSRSVFRLFRPDVSDR